ncbi:hypothetical protein BGX26_011426, partial [Mortierella sp. AD094]
LKLFNSAGMKKFLPTDPTIDRSFFYTMMEEALEDVQTSTLPGVQYICNKCGTHAVWTGQSSASALIWKFIFNTANTSVSVYALIVFMLAFSMKDSLLDLLPKDKDKSIEEMVPLVELEP